MHPLLTSTLAEQFASLTLRHLDREYPNKMDHVMASRDDVQSPKDLHPVFYGSFDWHSCVHGFWQLARLVRLFPDLSARAEIAAKFESRLTPENVQVELDYMLRPASKGFERPYGWAWLLMLTAEVKDHPILAGSFDRLSPLADLIVSRWMEFLPNAIYPIRVGTHPNFAFALTLSLEYARVTQHQPLQKLMRDKAKSWFLADQNSHAWEPSLDDFLSPSLMEAQLMRRVLDAATFREWFDRFLPNLRHGEPATLFQPASVTDRTDGKIAHLDGLNLSRGWCWRKIAEALPPDDPLRARLENVATAHIEASLPHLATDYAGEHWLATFALLAMS